MTTELKWLRSLAVASLLALAAPASAAIVVQDFTSDNDCSGLFNNGDPGFTNCEDQRGSPIIAKYDLGDEEKPASWSINTALFADVTSSMFTLTFDEADGSIGEWAYNRCATCPAITSFVVKAGNGFRWYYTNPTAALTEGEWETVGLQGLSHISFYDTLGVINPNVGTVPLPLPGLLLLGALGGLGLVRRKA